MYIKNFKNIEFAIEKKNQDFNKQKKKQISCEINSLVFSKFAWVYSK